MVSELVFNAIYSRINYQIEDFDERNMKPQISARLETMYAYICCRKFSILKLSRLTELNQAEPNRIEPSWTELTRSEPSRSARPSKVN